MLSRPYFHGNITQRIASTAPLAIFLLLLGICSWAGRDQLKAAVEASGTFIAAQLGQPKPPPARRPGRAVRLNLRSGADQAVRPVPKADATAIAAEPKKSEPVKEVKPAGPKVITEINDVKGQRLKILDLPIPEDCYPQQHADYAGDAVVWGLGHKKTSAAECCEACKQHQKEHANDRPCNIWVWCGDPSGVCWTMDIHNHTTGDCWLKHQAKWDNNPDTTFSNLEINHINKFSAMFRAVHKTAPEWVPWVSGAVPKELTWDMAA